MCIRDSYDILKQNHDTQVENGADIKLMSARELELKFPWLITAGVVAGCYGGNNEGWFDPWALLQAFKISAINRGADYITGRATHFSAQNGRLVKVLKNIHFIDI